MNSDIIQTSAILIENCLNTIKQFEQFYKQSGQKYNIFKIADISADEVKLCKVLGDLLNPKGNHYKGYLFLKQFLEVVNNKTQSPFIIDTRKARVKNEYSTDINRRIDIVIEDGNIFIPIEVKIFAKDQEKQVSHYAEFSRIKNKNKNIPVIYLTIEGTPPSNANKGEYITMSFRYDILKWLNNCLQNSDVEKSKPIYEVIKQLILSIKSICGISEDEKMGKAIQRIITQSEDNIKTALAIKQNLESLLAEADEKSCEIFYIKILSQVQKVFPDANYDEGDKWWYIYIPIKNGKYIFGINYNWQKIYIQAEESNKHSNLKEEKALTDKMTELTGEVNKNWDGFIWVYDKFSYPRFSNIDPELYFYYLYKEYSENTTEIVDLIINYANELNKV